MRYHLLHPIKGKDALAQLFSKYLKGLRTPMTIAEPSFYSMAEVRQAFDHPTTKEGECYHHCAENYFELTILRQSLEDLHSHVLGAISLLEGAFAAYGNDLHAYAIDNRRRTIEKYGSDDEQDWYRDNEADESEPWKVTHRTSPEALKHYTLHEELARFIIGHGRGEYIGTSGPNDFARPSNLVAQQSEFSFRKMVEGAWGAQLVQTNADGTTSPIPLADHIEREMNTDIKAADLVWRFNTSLGFCQVVGDRYKDLAPDDLVGLHTLLSCLQKVRDVDFPESLFYDLMNRPD